MRIGDENDKKIMAVCLSLGMVIGAVGCSKPSETKRGYF